MAQTVVITLTTAGADTGPFDLYSNVDGFAVPFEENVPKGDLEIGYISFLVPDAATTIRVQSDNPLCDNFIDLALSGTTTTSTTAAPTTTTTTTATPTTTTTTTLAPNTFTADTGDLTGDGTNVNNVVLTGNGFEYSIDPIGPGVTTPSVISGEPTSPPNFTPLTIVLGSAAAKTITGNTLVLRDMDTVTDYPGVVSGDGTNTVIITFSVDPVAGHVFRITGSAGFTGG